nr:hypothetical protein [Tanacetum cinerariifolium]
MREFHSCKQEEGQSISSYVLKMKSYIANIECLEHPVMTGLGEEGQSISSYVLKMKSYIANIERLEHPVTTGLGVSLILISLRKDFDGFVQNYNMHNMGKTINELHAMLKLHEQTKPKNNAPALHTIRAGKVQKGNNKHKKPNPNWLLGVKIKGRGKISSLMLPSPRFLLHPRGKILLRTLSVINARASVEAIGSYHLSLPSGLLIVLNNCHYASSITRGIISVSYLYDDGYVNQIVDNSIQVSRNNMVYFNVVPRDEHPIPIAPVLAQAGQQVASEALAAHDTWVKRSKEIVRLMLMTMDSKIQRNLESLGASEMLQELKTLFAQQAEQELFQTMREFHSCKQEEGKKRIEKLQHDGILNSTDLRAFEKCVPCMFGKMERKPYTHQVERAKDQLGLIYTDVCGAFKIVSRQRASYFVTFTNDFSQNGLIPQKASEGLEDLEIIQEEDTHPFIDTSLNHKEDDLEIDEPQSDIIPIRRSTRTRNAPDRMCLYIDVEEHELGDLDNEVWDLVELPPNAKTVGSKWLFKKKTDMDGAVHTYKARLVVKGYTQTSVIDYEETFSPVAYIRAIRILIAITTFYDYKIWQMDVKTAFLNGYLFEEVYIEEPKGFVNPKYPDRKFGFTQNRDEPCVYLKASGSNVTFLILYVDDILIMGNNIPMLQDVKSYLGMCFAMKDLGEAAYILRIKIYRDRSQRLIGLCHSAYIEKILKRYHMENSKHRRFIMYVVRCTRPDVAFAPNITSRFQQNPDDLYWTTVKNILKYLRNTKDMFLVYEGAIDWKNAKQSIFAASSAKAEYIAAFDASKEAVWVRKIISRLGVVPIIEEPISMYCDNAEAITIANESGITKGARHFRTKVQYLHK